VEAGTIKLVGTNTTTIIENVNLLLEDRQVYNQMAQAHNPHGDGKMSERLVKKFDRCYSHEKSSRQRDT